MAWSCRSAVGLSAVWALVIQAGRAAARVGSAVLIFKVEASKSPARAAALLCQVSLAGSFSSLALDSWPCIQLLSACRGRLSATRCKVCLRGQPGWMDYFSWGRKMVYFSLPAA